MFIKEQNEIDKDWILAFILFLNFLLFSFLSNFTYHFLNRPAYELTIVEKVFTFILIPITYFGLIGLIYLEIKLTRREFFENILKYFLKEDTKQ